MFELGRETLCTPTAEEVGKVMWKSSVKKNEGEYGKPENENNINSFRRTVALVNKQEACKVNARNSSILEKHKCWKRCQENNAGSHTMMII